METENLENQNLSNNTEIQNQRNDYLKNETVKNENISNNQGILLNEKGYQNLIETAKWAKFMNIVMTVMLGIVLTIGLIVMSVASKSFGTLLPEFDNFPFAIIIFAFSYIFAAGIYVYPIITIFKFSAFIKQSNIERNTEKLTEALKNLKNFTQYIGILTIIAIVGYGLILLIVALVGIAGGFNM